MVVKVSQSRVKTWDRCKQAHWYKYVEKLERVVKSRPLRFGSIMHELLEAHANKKDPFTTLAEIEKDQGNMFRSQREELGEILWAARIIMEAYLEYYSDHPIRYLKLNGQRSEHELEVEISDGIILVMKLDAIVKTPNKLRWLLENKTGKILPDEDDRWRNLQTSVYFKGCELLDMKPFDGVCWNYIRSKEPSRPGINQNGKMARRTNCDTLPDVVRAVAEENDIDDYLEQLEWAEERVDTWFKRIFTPVSPRVVDSIFGDFVTTSREIADFGKVKHQRTIDRHCAWCDYEAICRAELTGGDSDFVKEREYEKRKKRKKVKGRSSRDRN